MCIRDRDPNTTSVNLSYYDFNNGNLRYAYKADNSNVWYTMSIDGSGNDSGNYSSLSLDNEGNRHISYVIFDNNNLKYAYGPSGGTNGSGQDISWYLFDVDVSTNVGSYNSIFIDNEGNRHISYTNTDLSLKKNLKYAYGPAGNTSINWHLYYIEELNILDATSLYIDTSGHRHIAYIDFSNNEYMVKYAFAQDGSGQLNWNLYEIEKFGNNSTLGVSLSLDISRNIHIAYYDSSNDDLKYAYSPNGNPGADITWTINSIDTLGNVGIYPSLAIDPTTQEPSITYFKETSPVTNEIRIATNTSGNWRRGILDVSLNSITENGNSQLKIDGEGDKHLSYYDWIELDLVSESRIRYATNKPLVLYGDSCPTIEEIEFTPTYIDISSQATIIPVDPSFYLATRIEQKPFDPSHHLVKPC